MPVPPIACLLKLNVRDVYPSVCFFPTTAMDHRVRDWRLSGRLRRRYAGQTHVSSQHLSVGDVCDVLPNKLQLCSEGLRFHGTNVQIARDPQVRLPADVGSVQPGRRREHERRQPAHLHQPAAARRETAAAQHHRQVSNNVRGGIHLWLSCSGKVDRFHQVHQPLVLGR